MPNENLANAEVTVAAQDVHRWLQELGWEKRRSKHPSMYRFNPSTREQFNLIGEYCRMEQEKDDRQQAGRTGHQVAAQYLRK
jgi:hypothetical protein